MGLTRILTKQTDATRRAALQIAVQLPENVEEARDVLHQTACLLESFLIIAPREVWPRCGLASAKGPTLRRALAMLLGTLVILLPLGALVAHLTGLSAVFDWVLSVGVICASLTLGRSYAVALAAAGLVFHNLFVAPPIWTFAVPSTDEIMRAAGLLALALGMPSMVEFAADLRARISRASVLPVVSAVTPLPSRPEGRP
ncbi:hypothetical protein ACVWXO_008071 [Bradyrhizobium sp. LM2.7]